MTHDLKIEQCYLIHILEGKKNFEIRKNDRDFQIGDILNFLPLESEQYDVYNFREVIPSYKIVYVQRMFVIEGYLALGIKEI